MRRGTTPTFEVDCDIDLTGYKIFLTLKQNSTELTLTPTVAATETGCVLTATLTQEQTLGFRSGSWTQMQVRAINPAGRAVASNIMQVDVGAILRNGVISYG